jgi:hypothetical protein
MPANRFDSRALRRIAEDVVAWIEEIVIVPFDEDRRQDLTTSLVRQWVTYDGHATLFFEQQQAYFKVERTPSGGYRLGKERLKPTAVPHWIRQLKEDWKINPEKVPDLFDQLNRGQSAEVTNDEGIPVRLWVDPKKRSHGVDELVKQPPRPGAKRAYYKIAFDSLESHLDQAIDLDEMDELACCVAMQWQRHQGGAACIYREQEQFICTLTEQADGGCNVTVQRKKANLEPFLSNLGFTPDAISDVISRINHGQEIEFRDRQGVPSRLWFDHRAGRIRAEPLQHPAPAPASAAAPFLCPGCHAVLKLWQPGQQQQTCVHCGHTIVLPQ